MPMPLTFFARGFSAARTISGTIVVRAQYEILLMMKRRPHRQQHDLDRQHRHAPPCQHPEHRQHERG